VSEEKMKVYTASKLSKAPMWRKLINEWPEVDFTARWVTKHVGTTPDHPCFAKVFWQHDFADVKLADVVLVYADEGDHLRGALVEAGMAIAFGREVIVVGEHPDYSTWQFHPSVHRVPDLEHARTLLATMAMR
jgi:hypothetical protein